MYYSQLGQDEFIDNFFEKKEKGVFVDIGANDGVKLSNTFFLEKERKWNGICVEPLPVEFKKLQENRSSININVAVSDFNGETDFTYIEGYANMLSGIPNNYEKQYENYISESVKNHGDKVHNIRVPVRTLQSILDEYNILDIDFCSVDTEGSEYNILKSIDFDKTNIKIIVVENNSGETKVKEFLESKGYVLFKKISQDDFFINKKLIK